jgi:ribose 1,5-bisphosphokinase PhnN
MGPALLRNGLLGTSSWRPETRSRRANYTLLVRKVGSRSDGFVWGYQRRSIRHMAAPISLFRQGLPRLSKPGEPPRNTRSTVYVGAVLVGASAAGKSTLLANVRASFQKDSDKLQPSLVSFPTRLTTRTPRADDSGWENESVPLAVIDDLEYSEALLVRWTKRMSSGDPEHYAFRKSGLGWPVLGGNDELLNNTGSVRPDRHLLRRLYKIGVICSDETRQRRLLRRNPDLSNRPMELATRLQKTPATVIAQCNLIIDTTDGLSRRDTQGLHRLLTTLATEFSVHD